MSQKGPWTTPKRFKRTPAAAAAASRKKAWSTGGRRTLVRTWRNPSGSSGAWYGSPFGRSLRTEITFAENREIPVTAGIPYTYLYSINSLYDPNVTGTGNQPRFFDTLCGSNGGSAPYQQYRVYASKIEVTFIPTGSDSVTMRGLVGIGLFNTTATGPSTLSEMLARSDYKNKTLGYWSGGHDICKITRRCNNAQFFDVKDIVDNPDHFASYNANPASSGRWGITYVPYDEVSNRTLQMFVKIIYDCEFFNRNDVADS